VQRLQHQSVAAERDYDIGSVRIVIAVKSHQLAKRLLGLGAGARDKGNLAESLGHRVAICCNGRRMVVYTTLPVLVEMMPLVVRF
jgi:hypothetical protein